MSKRNVHVSVYLSENQIYNIKEKAYSLFLTQSDYIRLLLFNSKLNDITNSFVNYEAISYIESHKNEKVKPLRFVVTAEEKAFLDSNSNDLDLSISEYVKFILQNSTIHIEVEE